MPATFDWIADVIAKAMFVVGPLAAFDAAIRRRWLVRWEVIGTTLMTIWRVSGRDS